MHQPDGHFLGIAVVSVDTQVDAERLRVEYNGKVIDHTRKPNPALRTHAQGSSSNANQSGSNGKQKAPSSFPNKKENGKPLGLKLLDRISKPKMLPNHMDQIALLERQRANLQKSHSGGLAKASIMRIQPSIPSKDTIRRPRKSKAVKAAGKSNVGAASKVSRAKKKLNDSAMDLDGI
ncbi:hypothetical protein I310_00445 [Cryptococcus deuterogattii CA1014]|nr:hypothetical protein I310_00445 [Cryptococcus deuterogattii CA1014]KIS02185.1 hypothetical protein L804_00445 [Cryptococcus deuterogattii 2001/935-1]